MRTALLETIYASSFSGHHQMLVPSDHQDMSLAEGGGW